MALQSGVKGLQNTQISSATATQMALEDWAEDSAGLNNVNSSRFKTALFELADMWTETTDPQEYLDFLEYLFSSMCKAMQTFPHLTEAQRHNIKFQIKQQRFLADAKRTKAAKLDTLGIAHQFDDDSLTKLHRDFEKHCMEELNGTNAKEQRERNNCDSEDEEDDAFFVSCNRFTFDKIMALQGFPPSTTTRRLFDVFDTDQSGSIDFRELIVGLNMLSESSGIEVLAKKLFVMVDTRGKRFLTVLEVKKVVQQCLSLHNIVMKDGKVLEEWLKGLCGEKGVNTKLSVDEFVVAMRAHPELVPALMGSGLKLEQ